jgi:hypothetical protein
VYLVKIKKTEASQSPPQPAVNCAYPPRHVIEVIPNQGYGEGLNVSLDLQGTDDRRKFTLTNPQINTALSTLQSPPPPLPPAAAPLSPEIDRRELLLATFMWPLCTAVCSDL